MGEGGAAGEHPLPEDLVGALKDHPQGWPAFQDFPGDQARDLVEWIESTKTAEHRAQRIQMVVELVADHFAKLRKIDLTEEPARNDD